MEKINELINHLGDKTPFALTRFNDGEMMGIDKVGSIVARGDQYVDQILNLALLDAIRHKQKNYYVGIPCSKCFPNYHKLAKSLVKNTKYVTSAVVTTNRNYDNFSTKLPELLKNRHVAWIGGEHHNLKLLRKITGIDVNTFIKVSKQNCWSDYDRVYNFVDHLHDGDVVLLSCGPMSEVLIHKWFKKKPKCTFIDIGSLYDPYTMGRWLKCHTGVLAPCEECN